MAINNVVPAQQEHIDYMKSRIRDVDRLECRAANGKDAGDMLQIGFNISMWTDILLCDEGNPCCAIGVVARKSGHGTPWMLATDGYDKIVGALKRVAKAEVKKMLVYFDYLENWVDARNMKAIRPLKWLGFNIEAPEPYGVKGKLFHRFWLTYERGL